MLCRSCGGRIRREITFATLFELPRDCRSCREALSEPLELAVLPLSTGSLSHSCFSHPPAPPHLASICRHIVEKNAWVVFVRWGEQPLQEVVWRLLAALFEDLWVHAEQPLTIGALERILSALDEA